MRIPQVQGKKGSLKWIQVLINSNPEVIDHQLGFDSIEWHSPLADDEYSEYRDGDFLRILGLDHLQHQHKDFWPRSGAQWDALGKAGNKIFLVEAKANVPEIKSSCAAKSPKSIIKIEKAISDTKVFFNVTDNDSWLDSFYQLQAIATKQLVILVWPATSYLNSSKSTTPKRCSTFTCLC